MFVMFVRQIVGITVYLLTMQHIMLHFSFLKYMYIYLYLYVVVFCNCVIYIYKVITYMHI